MSVRLLSGNQGGTADHFVPTFVGTFFIILRRVRRERQITKDQR